MLKVKLGGERGLLLLDNDLADDFLQGATTRIRYLLLGQKLYGGIEKVSGCGPGFGLLCQMTYQNRLMIG